MLRGKCPVCGSLYYGWALKTPRHRYCSCCGAALEIDDFKGVIPDVFRPFGADRLAIEPGDEFIRLWPPDEWDGPE